PLPRRVRVQVQHGGPGHPGHLHGEVGLAGSAGSLQLAIGQLEERMMNRKLCVLVVGVALGACRPAVKAPVHDTFTKVGQADAQVAPFRYGSGSKVVKTRGDYGWFQFAGRAGDDVEIAVRSGNGDAVAFLLDANDDVVASN